MPARTAAFTASPAGVLGFDPALFGTTGANTIDLSIFTTATNLERVRGLAGGDKATTPRPRSTAPIRSSWLRG